MLRDQEVGHDSLDSDEKRMRGAQMEGEAIYGIVEGLLRLLGLKQGELSTHQDAIKPNPFSMQRHHVLQTLFDLLNGGLIKPLIKSDLGQLSEHYNIVPAVQGVKHLLPHFATLDRLVHKLVFLVFSHSLYDLAVVNALEGVTFRLGQELKLVEFDCWISERLCHFGVLERTQKFLHFLGDAVLVELRSLLGLLSWVGFGLFSSGVDRLLLDYGVIF